MLHHPPPQPEPSLVQLLVVWRDVAKPDIAGEEDLQVPVLVEGDQVTDVSVAHIGFLCQHSRHKNVVNSEDSFVAVLERLGTFDDNVPESALMFTFKSLFLTAALMM